MLRAWELNRYIYYIQEYLPHFQEDIRAFVVGGEVVAAMRPPRDRMEDQFLAGRKGGSVRLERRDEGDWRLRRRAA